MLAVIKVGGKQYLVSPGKKIRVEKLEKEEGSDISFSDVLLFQNEKDLEIGAPAVKGVKVTGKIVKQGRTKKIIVLKYHPKVRYKVRKGHRQHFTEIVIGKIEAGK